MFVKGLSNWALQGAEVFTDIVVGGSSTPRGGIVHRSAVGISTREEDGLV